MFKVPVFIITGIVLYLLLYYGFHLILLASIIIALTILLGSIDLLRDTVQSILRKKFALDYIALLAITTGVISGEFLVAAVIVLMLAGGQTLEKFAVARAKKSLTALTDRIPSTVLLWNKDIEKTIEIADVRVGQKIIVRKGEVIPLDGVLDSETGLADESSLTGEPYEIEKIQGDTIRSGTVNTGSPMVITVTRVDKDSTYRKIVDMVRAAQSERSPLIRVADRYSGIFTVIPLLLAGFAYSISRDFHQVLAVLVIATPCPLILAAPIALMGGMNALAKQKIIAKTLTSVEVLSRVTDIMFDKTGTITLGRPRVVLVDIKNKKHSKAQVLGIAEAIERNSLHPFAKAIVRIAREENVPRLKACDVHEKIGYGIVGTVGATEYVLSKLQGGAGFAIELRMKNSPLAVFHFQDAVKVDSKRILGKLKLSGLHLSIFTGDKKEATEQLLKSVGGIDISVKTECTPEDKMKGIQLLRKQGRVTAMVGDGINDAPALAAADVGMVFSNEEQTAASEAADLVFLGGDFSLVLTSLGIAKRTMNIALQSIWFGIGLSILGMTFASVGMIPPLMGAFIQEVIDVAVIFNALRASR